MQVTLTRKTIPQEIINLGWEVLTKEMGAVGCCKILDVCDLRRRRFCFGIQENVGKKCRRNPPRDIKS